MSSEQVSVQATVDDSIEADGVVLFMKGTQAQPRCGFSQRALGLISQHREDYQTVNVLDSLPEYRAALEAHSGWETIPQVYVDGEFVGGSDILSELDEQGDLESTLQAE